MYVRTIYSHCLLLVSERTDSEIKLNHHHHHYYLSPLWAVFTIMHLKQTTFLGYIVLHSCSVVTLYSTCNVTSYAECSVLLPWYFLQHVCSAQYGCFLYFPDVMLSSNDVQIFSEWFWDGSSCPYFHKGRSTTQC